MATSMSKGYTPVGKLGTGTRFGKVQSQAAQGYIKKGYSPKTAAKIGGAIAASAGRAKFGATKMAKLSAKGRKG